MRFGIVVSNAAVAAATHTTILLAAAALARGHTVRLCEPWDFEVETDGRLTARAHAFDAPSTPEALVEGLVQRSALRRSVEVDRLDVLLLRANPFQDTIITFAQMAQAAGVRVLNEPGAMALTSHKGWLAGLDGVPRPRTLLTRSRSALARFASESETGVVVKPARSCGGRGVGLVRGRHVGRLEAAVDTAMRAGDGYVVVQDYLPAARDGERRLLWLDGTLIGGYLRSRAPGEFRHNLKVGGVPAPHVLTPADHALAATLTPHLQKSGVWFAGLDAIGDRIIEVNALNPGGLHWSSVWSGEPLAERVIAALEPSRPRARNTLPPEIVA